MIEFNWLILLISSCIPIIVGYLLFNTNFYKKISKSNEQLNLSIKWSLVSIIGLFTLSFMYSITLSYQVIHQLHFQSMLINEVGFEKGEGNAYKDLIYIFELYGKNFRSFKHGAFHGLLNSIFIVLPILVYSKYTSASSWRSVIFQWMFWMICGVLMGGIICELY